MNAMTVSMATANCSLVGSECQCQYNSNFALTDSMCPLEVDNNTVKLYYKAVRT